MMHRKTSMHHQHLGIPSATTVQQLAIQKSDSLNQHDSFGPANAHDGDYNTWYCVKEGTVEENFLKLYLTKAYSITEVKVISRGGNEFADRMANTEARVYSVNGEIELASCGKITGKNMNFTFKALSSYFLMVQWHRNRAGNYNLTFDNDM